MIRLVRPAPEHKNKALEYRQAHFEHGEMVINGSELLDKTDSYEEWLQSVKDNENPETVNPDWVVTDTFFAVNEEEEIVGIIDLRHTLNDFLKDFGNCGYSVHPAHRRKGYATMMLCKILDVAKQAGMKELHLSVERDNAPSVKTIIRNGGVYERSFVFEGAQADIYRIMLERNIILSEFDPVKTAVINPENFVKPVKDMPEVAVACYSKETFDRIIRERNAEVIAATSTANGEIPIYRTDYKKTKVALFMITVGAPESAALLEDVFMMGVKKAIVFGTCGVLERSIEDCSVIIPDSAVRDEGTSYHYAPASDKIEVNRKYMDIFTDMLEELHIKYTVGKAWTTDAFYRETPDKIKRRKEQGCICVDMECSANAAVAAFREKDLVQFFYAADNLDAEEWDVRSLSNHAKLEEKDRIAMIAMELAVRIS